MAVRSKRKDKRLDVDRTCERRNSVCQELLGMRDGGSSSQPAPQRSSAEGTAYEAAFSTMGSITADRNAAGNDAHEFLTRPLSFLTASR